MNDLLAAYAAGWFSMAEGPIGLSAFSCAKRALIPLDQRFHVPRSLKRQLRPGRFELKLNSAFAAVVDGCADRPSTWISLELRAIYKSCIASAGPTASKPGTSTARWRPTGAGDWSLLDW